MIAIVIPVYNEKDSLALLMGEIAQGVHGVDLDEPALADDGHATARLLDLREDVR